MTILPKVFFTLIITVLIHILGCQNSTTTTNEIPEYVITDEDHSQGYTFPSQGIYYEYSFSSYTEHIENIEEFLIDLHYEGIIIIDSWYQGGSSMCVAPGDSTGATVIVEPRFIILLENENITFHNFSFVENPSYIFCGYYVKRYTLKQ